MVKRRHSVNNKKVLRIIRTVFILKRNFLFSQPKNRFSLFLLSLVSTLHKQALLGVLFVLTSFPLFTMLSSWTALFFVSKKLIRGEEIRAFKDYFSLFFSSFKKTILPSVVFMLLFAAGGYSAWVYFSLSTPLSAVGGVLCVSFLLLSALVFLFFPCGVSSKRTNFFELFDLFVLLLPRLALSLVFVLLVSGVPLLLLPFSLPLVLTLCFPLTNMICAFLLDKESDEE